VKGSAVVNVVRLVDAALSTPIPRIGPPLKYTGTRLTYVMIGTPPMASARFVPSPELFVRELLANLERYLA
jgi:hypothetical protein